MLSHRLDKTKHLYFKSLTGTSLIAIHSFDLSAQKKPRRKKKDNEKTLDVFEETCLDMIIILFQLSHHHKTVNAGNTHNECTQECM